jgi:hypothetical protein
MVRRQRSEEDKREKKCALFVAGNSILLYILESPQDPFRLLNAGRAPV